MTLLLGVLVTMSALSALGAVLTWRRGAVLRAEREFRDDVRYVALQREVKLLRQSRDSDPSEEFRQELHSRLVSVKNELHALERRRTGGLFRKVRKMQSRIKLDPRGTLLAVQDIFGYLFPKKLRTEVYEPSRDEIKADFCKAMRCRKPWKRLLVIGIFVLRTALLVTGTMRVGIARKVLPKRLRDWWAA